MVERVMPIARESSDHAFLNVFKPMDRYESGAARQRRLYREHGSWQELIDDSVRRFQEDVAGASTSLGRPGAVAPGAGIDVTGRLRRSAGYPHP